MFIHVYRGLQSYYKSFLQCRYPLTAKVKPHIAALGWSPGLNRAPRTGGGLGAQTKAPGSTELFG